MSDPTSKSFIASLAARVPVWLTRPVGWKFLTTMVFLADTAYETLLQALYARWPGVGTPTALPLIGQSRGMIQGMTETFLAFAARLIQWLSLWQTAGTALTLAKMVQAYVAGSPKVIIVNRFGVMTTLNSDGTNTVNYASGWDYDSLSNPERAGFWSEIWIIVFAPPWPIASATYPAWYWGVLNVNGWGLGFQIPRVDVDAIRSIVDTWKSAHTYVRAVIYTYDSTLFDPTNPSKMPDGTWGQNSYAASPPHRTRSGRPRTCRFVQPERDPNTTISLPSTDPS